MLKSISFFFMLTLVVSCYGNTDYVYSQKFKNIKIYDVDKIEDNTVVLISKDLKTVKKVKKSVFTEEIKEGYQVTYVNGEIYINKNKKLDSKISKLLFELNPENKTLSLKL